jgi:hypothetical protein
VPIRLEDLLTSSPITAKSRCSTRWPKGKLDVAPTDGIEIASSSDKPLPILSDQEIAAMLKTCCWSPSAGPRCHAE